MPMESVPVRHPVAKGKVRAFVDLSASVAMLAAASLIIWSYFHRPEAARKELAIPSAPISLDGASTQGSFLAPVAILEFADFQCPACRVFAEQTHHQLVKEFVETGKVLFAFRHLPLTTIHPQAMGAAIAAQCAEGQRSFWKLYDWFFRNPTRLGSADISSIASGLGMDVAKLEACMSDAATVTKIKQDVAEADRYGVFATPSFFVGKLQPDGALKVVAASAGAVDIEHLKRTIDQVTILLPSK